MVPSTLFCCLCVAAEVGDKPGHQDGNYCNTLVLYWYHQSKWHSTIKRNEVRIKTIAHTVESVCKTAYET